MQLCLRCLLRPTMCIGKQGLRRQTEKENKQLFTETKVAVGISEPSMYSVKLTHG